MPHAYWQAQLPKSVYIRVRLPPPSNSLPSERPSDLQSKQLESEVPYFQILLKGSIYAWGPHVFEMELLRTSLHELRKCACVELNICLPM